MSKDKKEERPVDNVPLGTGMLDRTRNILLERRKRMESMNKGGSKKKEPKDNN